MPASRTWIEAALSVFGRYLSHEQALALVRDLKALRGANASVRVTLERMEADLSGRSGSKT